MNFGKRQRLMTFPMKRILVADDDNVITLAITRELQKHRYGTLTANDVVQAMMILTRSQVDAVIVDLKMPGGSAFDVIRRMKNSNRLGPLPIIAISSSMTAGIEAGLRRRGADCCMQKPVDLKELVLALQTFLDPPEAEEKTNSVMYGGA